MSTTARATPPRRIEIPKGVEETWQLANTVLARLGKVEQAHPGTFVAGSVRYGLNRVRLHISVTPGPERGTSIAEIEAHDRQAAGVASRIVVDRLIDGLTASPSTNPSTPTPPRPAPTPAARSAGNLAGRAAEVASILLPAAVAGTAVVLPTRTGTSVVKFAGYTVGTGLLVATGVVVVGTLALMVLAQMLRPRSRRAVHAILVSSAWAAWAMALATGPLVEAKSSHVLKVVVVDGHPFAAWSIVAAVGLQLMFAAVVVATRRDSTLVAVAALAVAFGAGFWRFWPYGLIIPAAGLVLASAIVWGGGAGDRHTRVAARMRLPGTRRATGGRAAASVLAGSLVLVPAAAAGAGALVQSMSAISNTLTAGTYAGTAQSSASTFEELSFSGRNATGSVSSSLTATTRWSITISRSKGATGTFQMSGPITITAAGPTTNCNQQGTVTWNGTIAGSARGPVAAVTLHGNETTSGVTCAGLPTSSTASEQLDLPLATMSGGSPYSAPVTPSIVPAPDIPGSKVSGSISGGSSSYSLSSAPAPGSPHPAPAPTRSSGTEVEAGVYSGTATASGGSTVAINLPSGAGAATETTTVSATGSWSVTVNSAKQASGKFQMQGPLKISTVGSGFKCTESGQFEWSGTISGTAQGGSVSVALQGGTSTSATTMNCSGQTISVPDVNTPGSPIRVTLPLGRLAVGDSFAAPVFDAPISGSASGVTVGGQAKGTLTFAVSNGPGGGAPSPTPPTTPASPSASTTGYSFTATSFLCGPPVADAPQFVWGFTSHFLITSPVGTEIQPFLGGFTESGWTGNDYPYHYRTASDPPSANGVFHWGGSLSGNFGLNRFFWFHLVNGQTSYIYYFTAYCGGPGGYDVQPPEPTTGYVPTTTLSPCLTEPTASTAPTTPPTTLPNRSGTVGNEPSFSNCCVNCS